MLLKIEIFGNPHLSYSYRYKSPETAIESPIQYTHFCNIQSDLTSGRQKIIVGSKNDQVIFYHVVVNSLLPNHGIPNVYFGTNVFLSSNRIEYPVYFF